MMNIRNEVQKRNENYIILMTSLMTSFYHYVIDDVILPLRELLCSGKKISSIQRFIVKKSATFLLNLNLAKKQNV